jgi:hypothetical protein
VAWVAGVGATGAVVSMRKAHPPAPHAAPAGGWPPATPVPEGRLVVAVVLGSSGSVITDALGPYEVFARSPEFFVYTVSASRPTAMLSGGLAVIPDYSLAEVDAGLAPEPDLVVVPAVAAPNGKNQAPPRDWITRRVDRLIVPGVGAIEEVDSQLLGWAADRGLTVELPNGGQAAGRFSFDAMLDDLAGHSDQTTARVTAKSIEYPTEQLELAGVGWPWRPTALLASPPPLPSASRWPRQPPDGTADDAPTNAQPTGRAVAAGTGGVGRCLGCHPGRGAAGFVVAGPGIGFAVADGRPRGIAIEAGVAAVLVVVAAAGVTGPAWLLVAAVLPGYRRGRRCHPGRADPCRRRLPPLGRCCLGRWPQDSVGGSLRRNTAGSSASTGSWPASRCIAGSTVPA